MVLAVLVGAALYAAVASGFLGPRAANPCEPLGGATELRTTLSHSNVTAIAEWQLPGPSRYPNAVAAAPDGSVWFGEEAVPGVAHLYPANGTLVEYAWPSAAPVVRGSCPFKTSIWGVALWRGMIWGTDGDGNVLVGLNPSNGSSVVLPLPLNNSFPYTLSVGPDGALWFTALAQRAYIGRVSTSLAVSMYPVLQNTAQVPSEIQFVNSTFAYFSTLDPTQANASGVYSFDPQDVAGGVTPTRVGGNTTLYELTSVSSTQSAVWAAQHATSEVAGYNLGSREWTFYPTSIEGYTNVTLPYFVRASGATVWFNEHYANRIAELEPAPVGTLTEYSEANPPIGNGTQVQNDETIALVPGGLWITATTGNYVGLASASYAPSFRMSVQGSNSVELSLSRNATVQLLVTGSWKTSLNVSASDSERYDAEPRLIGIALNATAVPAGAGEKGLTVRLTLKGALTPGGYTVAVTVSDGLILQTDYIFVAVS